jgi:hypothetical protein
LSIFTEMYDLHHFESVRARQEFLRKLSIALEEGWVEEIPVAIKTPFSGGERWFREPRSGEVYCFGPPGEKSTGTWDRVDPQNLFPSKPFATESDTVN